MSVSDKGVRIRAMLEKGLQSWRTSPMTRAAFMEAFDDLDALLAELERAEKALSAGSKNRMDA